MEYISQTLSHTFFVPLRANINTGSGVTGVLGRGPKPKFVSHQRGFWATGPTVVGDFFCDTPPSSARDSFYIHRTPARVLQRGGTQPALTGGGTPHPKSGCYPPRRPLYPQSTPHPSRPADEPILAHVTTTPRVGAPPTVMV